MFRTLDGWMDGSNRCMKAFTGIFLFFYGWSVSSFEEFHRVVLADESDIEYQPTVV